MTGRPAARDLGRIPLATLVAGQALGLSGAPLVIMVGSIAGQELAPNPGLATLPLATMVVGTAIGSAPVALLMRRVGRRIGFALAAASAALAGLGAALALETDGFVLLSMSTLLLGATLAAVQQYRFAAAEIGGSERAGRAVAIVLAGGILAGVLGPEIGRRARDLTPTPYVGSFLIIACVYAALVIILLAGLPADRPSTGRARSDSTGRSPSPAREAKPSDATGEQPVSLRTPAFLVAVTAGVTAYSVMTLVMTAAPLAMQRVGHDVDGTALVIQAHVVAMYAPSLVSGLLVARLGVGRLLGAGALTLAASLGCGLVADGLVMWVTTLALLGIGWNLLFLGGTVALTTAYANAGRYRAQAVNDTLVFGARAVASLGSGLVLAVGGWVAIQSVAVVPLLAMALVLTLRASSIGAAAAPDRAPRRRQAAPPAPRR